MMSLSADSEALEEALLREGVHLDGGEACLRVNTAATCLLGLHELMPSLLRLTLDGSCVVSVRDLGTRLPHLLMLSLNDCGLSELEGVAAFPQLRELSACSNRIADTSGLAMHAHLTVLRMSANRVCSLSVTDALSTCPKLAHLSLDLNPIHSAPNYTLVVAALLPQLISLDGHEVDRSNKVSHAMVLDTAAALSIIEDEMAEELRMERVIFQPDDVLPVGSDADSELTYGASESLAGSAASAVRRRRARMREVGEMSIGGSSESVLHLLDRALSSNGKGKDEVRHESLLTHVPQEGPRRPVSASVRPSSSASLESPRQINASRPQSQSNRRTYSTFLCEPLRIVHIDEERQRVMPMARSRDSRDGDGSGSEEDEDRQGGENLGRALGFDLTGSLAAIEEWARELGDSDDSGDTPDDTPNATPRARTRAVPKTGRCEAPGSVLSRADILSMVGYLCCLCFAMCCNDSFSVKVRQRRGCRMEGKPKPVWGYSMPTSTALLVRRKRSRRADVHRSICGGTA